MVANEKGSWYDCPMMVRMAASIDVADLLWRSRPFESTESSQDMPKPNSAIASRIQRIASSTPAC